MDARTSTPPARLARRVRAGAVILLLGMATLAAGQVAHGPDVSPSRDLPGFVAAFATARLAAAHLVIAAATVLLALGVAAVYLLLAATRSEGTALAAFVATTLGAALMTLGLGAAALALPDVARTYGESPTVIGPLLSSGGHAGWSIIAGGGLLVAGGVLVGIAVWRSGILPRYRGVPYALALPLSVLTRNLPSGVKVVVGLLMVLAAWWLVDALRRVPPPPTSGAAV